MGSKEDWEELEKWQKEQEDKKTADEKVYTQKFENKKVTNIRIFSKIFNFITKSMITLMATILGIAAIGAILYAYSNFKQVTPENTLKYLKQIYGGQEFKILSYEGEDKYQKGKGLYKLSPKNNPNIVFKAYNAGSGIAEDYEAQRVKYYIDNCTNKSLIEDFEIDTKFENKENIQFLRYNINLCMNNYSELDEKVEKIYNLEKYLNSKDYNIYTNVVLVNKNVNYYFGIDIRSCKDLEYMKYRFRDSYIRFVKENNCVNEIKNIGLNEIKEYYRPENLKLIVNGKQLKLYNDGDAIVYYFWKTKKYNMSGVDAFINQIEPMEVVKKSKFTGEIKKIKYNGKKIGRAHV